MIKEIEITDIMSPTNKPIPLGTYKVRTDRTSFDPSHHSTLSIHSGSEIVDIDFGKGGMREARQLQGYIQGSGHIKLNVTKYSWE